MTIEERLRLWEQRLEEYEASGQSVLVWCEEKSITPRQFYYWRKKLRSAQSGMDQRVKWISLNHDFRKSAGLAADSIAVHVGRVTVEIRKGFDQHLFREIVQVLQTI